MSSARVRNNSVCKLDNESGGIDWPYCISFQTRPLLICADLQFAPLHTVQRCTFQPEVHSVMIEFFVLSGFTLKLWTLCTRAPARTTVVHLSVDAALHMQCEKAAWTLLERPEVWAALPTRLHSPHSYFVMTNGVKPPLLPASVTCLFAERPQP